MNLRSKVFLLSLIAPLAAILLLSAAYQGEKGGHEPGPGLSPLDRQIEELTDLCRLIMDRYAAEVDSETLLMNAVRGLIGNLPYSELKERAEFEEEITGEYVGLGLYCNELEERLFVSYTLHDSPSYAYLERGDEILEVEGVPVAELGREEAYRRMRGDGVPGSICRLEVLKSETGRSLALKIPRAVVKRPSVWGGLVPAGDGTVGYIRIERFLVETHSEFIIVFDILREKKIDALILDLRSNPGGVLDSARNIANFFIAEGILVKVLSRQPGGDRTYGAVRSHCLCPEMDLTVLINGHTVSAAEVLAGALQDYRRAVLVGTGSFGKGVVQTGIHRKIFGKDLVVKIPTGLYYLPSGRCIEKNPDLVDNPFGGLEPDFVVPLSREEQLGLESILSKPTFDFQPDLKTGKEDEEPHPPDPQKKAALRILRGETVCSPIADPDERK